MEKAAIWFISARRNKQKAEREMGRAGRDDMEWDGYRDIIA
jgi:hypothetical protein